VEEGGEKVIMAGCEGLSHTAACQRLRRWGEGGGHSRAELWRGAGGGGTQTTSPPGCTKRALTWEGDETDRREQEVPVWGFIRNFSAIGNKVATPR